MKNKDTKTVCYMGRTVENPSDGYMRYVEKFGDLDLKFMEKLPWQFAIVDLVCGEPEYTATDDMFGAYLSSCVDKNQRCNTDNLIDYFYLGEDGRYRDKERSIESDSREDFIQKVDKCEPDFIR